MLKSGRHSQFTQSTEQLYSENQNAKQTFQPPSWQPLSTLQVRLVQDTQSSTTKHLDDKIQT